MIPKCVDVDFQTFLFCPFNLEITIEEVQKTPDDPNVGYLGGIDDVLAYSVLLDPETGEKDSETKTPCDLHSLRLIWEHCGGNIGDLYKILDKMRADLEESNDVYWLVSDI